MIAAGIVQRGLDEQRARHVREDVAPEDGHVAGAVRDRGADVVLLAQRERLAARDAHERRHGRDPERERRVQQRRAEDRGQADGEDQEREGEEHVRDAGDHRVELAPVVAGGEAEGDGDDHREHRGEEARQDRGPRAVDDAREGVATEVVGPEQVLARRAGQDGVEVRLRGAIGGDPRCEHRREDDRDDDDERADRGRPAQEAPAEDAAAPRPRAERDDLDDAHVLVPATRMRGLMNE